jgi:beta-fructofuranosidase
MIAMSPLEKSYRGFVALLFISFANTSHAQLSVRYDASVQPTSDMQYFKPIGNNLFVGDCIPFFHDDTYYLYWLIDSAHHSALNGLGGHQWVLSTTKNLKHWKNYPIVLGIDEDWEKSICTGSVVFANKKFYAFYATRLINDGKVNEQLSYAISEDGIHFKKQKPNPFYTSAPGYSKRDFRDPKVFVDSEGIFHLFVSTKKDSAMLDGYNGALVHLTSRDFQNWQVKAPVLTGQNSVPECPDYFYWNGWYYLVYGDNSNTYYIKSRNPYGPWQQPPYQALNEDWANVVKTAEFSNGRRIAAAWIPSRLNNKDNEREIFGGNAIFREVLQQKDGTLNTKFPPELLPESRQALSLHLKYDSLTTKSSDENFMISSTNGIGAAHFENIPNNSRITLQIIPQGPNESYGLFLRSNNKAAGGYKLSFSANNSKAELGNTSISGVEGLDKAISVDIIMKDDIIDVCIDNRRCIVNRTVEQKGGFLWLYVKHGNVQFKSVKVYPLSDIQSNIQPK